VSQSRQPAGDAFCSVVRVTVGERQVEALAAVTGARGRRGRRDALEQALMASAWSSARPGEAASDWLRVVHPIDPPLDEMAPGRRLLVLVAGLRREVARAAAVAEAGEPDKRRLARARESFGEPAREQIITLLARAAAHED
jgi:hypothetical protein